ncbi:MAG: PH domain-containing protein [Candidatus Hodarchaeales archaeon]|jgi:membrane protein YdbS with pleckstrin-like domain
MTGKSSSKHLYPNIRLIKPGNRYIVKRLVKIIFDLLVLDLIIIAFFGLMTLIPFDDPEVVEPAPAEIRSMIWVLCLVSVLIISMPVLVYSAIGIPWLVKTLSYEITDEALVVRRGRLTKVEIFVPYRTMTNIGMTKGPFDRIFSIGHLSIETAGMALAISGKIGVDQYIEGLEYTVLQDVYDYIYSQMRKLKGTYSTTTEDFAEASIDDGKEGELYSLIRNLTDEIKELRKAVVKLQK